MSYIDWIKTKEGKDWLKERSNTMKKSNPMFDPVIIKKMTIGRDYKKIAKKISQTRLKRIKEGRIKPFKHTAISKEKISKANTGSNNGMWKGDKVKLYSLHRWVERHKPKPEVCEICKEREPYDLANISGKYKRDINDYKWLCRRCHMKEDGRYYKWQWHKQK